MDKEKNNKMQNNGLSLLTNIGLNINLFQKQKNKIKTFTSENNKNSRNRSYLSNLKFGQNLLIWLLKKPKYLNNNKENNKEFQTAKNRDNYFIEKIKKGKISEKFKIIPGIDKLYHLTDQSINDILKNEQDKFEFTTQNSINIFSNNELKKRINNIYKYSFKINKKLSINVPKEENGIQTKDETNCKPLSLSSKLKHKSKNKIFNTRFLYNNLNNKTTIKTYNNNNFQDYLKLENESINNNNFDSKLLLMKNKQIQKSDKLYTKPNEDLQKVIIENNKNIDLKIIQKEPKNKRLNSEKIFKKKAHTQDNLLDQKRLFKSPNKEKKEKSNIEKKNINNKGIQFLKKSSNVDRLLFKLENPYDTFEENVFYNRPGDKFIGFKNQIIKQRNKTTKMFCDYKMDVVLNEIFMKRYIYKVYSDRNKKIGLY